MKPFALILALTAVAAACGCYLAAIPRYKEIKRPVTTSEVAGTWVLTAKSERSLAVDGVTRKPNEEFAIVLKPDGSCSYHTLLRGGYVEKDGVWSARYDPRADFRNRLDFRFKDIAISMNVALDLEGMVLWESWGDPDQGIDLVYRKKETGEPNGATNGTRSDETNALRKSS